jgi:hypothetical protein
MMTRTNRRVMTIAALAAIVLLQSVHLATSARAISSPAADLDLRAECATLDAFLADLVRFDKRGVELGKQASLTQPELVAYEKSANDLKSRVSSVQNALRQTITKLKAAGLYDNIDQTVLSRITNSRFQAIARRDGFKKTLEEVASGVAGAANEISVPDSLRSKVRAQLHDPNFEPGNTALAARAVRVAYSVAPLMFTATFKCKVALVRFGISGATHDGEPTEKSANRVSCFCDGDSQACNALFSAQ